MADKTRVVWIGRTPPNRGIMVVNINGRELPCIQDGSVWYVNVDLDDPLMTDAIAGTRDEAKETGQMLVAEDVSLGDEENMMLLIAKTDDINQLVLRINQCTDLQWVRNFRAAANELNMSDLVAICDSKISSMEPGKETASPANGQDPRAASAGEAPSPVAEEAAAEPAAEPVDDLDI